MAAVLQHQVVDRVNELNNKMTMHARLLMNLALEFDKMKSENEELKKIIKGHRRVLRNLVSDKTDTESVSETTDIMTINKATLKEEFKEFNNQLLEETENSGVNA